MGVTWLETKRTGTADCRIRGQRRECGKAHMRTGGTGLYGAPVCHGVGTWGWNQISKGLEGQAEALSLHFLINWNSSKISLKGRVMILTKHSNR